MRKPFSYANVTATLALVFAMTGGRPGREPLPGRIDETDQAFGAQEAEGQQGRRPKARPATAGRAGWEGPQGSTGGQGPAGSAVAFAHVLGESNPTSPLDAANSKNISLVTNPATGAYCVGTTVPISNVSGGLADFNAGGPAIIITANFTRVAEIVKSTTCPPGTTVLVETSKAEAPSRTPTSGSRSTDTPLDAEPRIARRKRTWLVAAARCG